jgi:hypothetical protein
VIPWKRRPDRRQLYLRQSPYRPLLAWRAGVVAAVAAVSLSAPVSTQQSALPELTAFAGEVRRHLMSDRALQSQYTYLERREEISVSKLGKVSAGPVKMYEVYPSLDPGNTYKRLISINGVPLPPEDLAKSDRIHREDVLRELQKREHETPEQRIGRERTEARERAETEAVLDEIFALYNITLTGREVIDGHSMVIATLEPKPQYRPRTDEGKLMKKLRARAWISETEYQVARVEIEVIDDVTYGWGIAGRLHRGTTGVFERRKINNEVWLPSRAVIKGSGRALLFRRFSLDSTTTYSDYRKFNVATDEAFTSRQ